MGLIILITLAAVIYFQRELLCEMRCLMATVAGFDAQITALGVDVARVKAVVQELQNQVAAGGTFSQADLDRFGAELQTVQDDLTTIK